MTLRYCYKYLILLELYCDSMWSLLTFRNGDKTGSGSGQNHK